MQAGAMQGLVIKGLVKEYVPGKPVLRGIDLAIAPQGITAVIGPSGTGKSTLLRCINRLVEPTAGEILLNGQDLVPLRGRGLRMARRRIGMVFQEYNLVERLTVMENVLSGRLGYVSLWQAWMRRYPEADIARAFSLLDSVGLPEQATRRADALSGGQRQRVGIARALAMEPEFIVCDEPVSALDVSIQGQIINLLENLQHKLNLTYLFIAHDLAVVRHISDRVVVMYLGRLMEMADGDALYADPLHPYTKALLDAAPVPDPSVERARAPRALKGETPSPLNPPSGCVFHTRCPLADGDCKKIVPEPREVKPGHFVACIKV